MHTLLYNVEPVVAITPAVQTAAAHTGNVIDGTGYDRAAFVMMVGSSPGAATMVFQVSKSATSNGTFTVATGASFVSFSSTATITNRCAIMDIPVDPAKPHMKVIDTVGTATLDGACLCLLYKESGTLPISPVNTTQAHGAVIAAKNVVVTTIAET
jgi:hypothetical protein